MGPPDKDASGGLKGLKMRRSSVLVWVLLAAGCVGAAGDSYLTIDNQGSGVCYGLDSTSNIFCQNETMRVNGSMDHVIYVLPYGEYRSSLNVTEKAEALLIDPWYWLLGILGFLVFVIVFVVAAYWAMSILQAGIP